MKPFLYRLLWISFLIVLICLLFTFGQRTSTKAAKKDAMKKRAHEAAVKEANFNSGSMKNRPETLTDKITKRVKSHLKSQK